MLNNQADESLSTYFCPNDKKYALKDEFGALYSPDGRRLISLPSDVEKYSIKEGTEIICDGAFDGCSKIKKLNIPCGVVKIGAYAFRECKRLRHVQILGNPESFDSFVGCCNIDPADIEERFLEDSCAGDDEMWDAFL